MGPISLSFSFANVMSISRFSPFLELKSRWHRIGISSSVMPAGMNVACSQPVQEIS